MPAQYHHVGNPSPHRHPLIAHIAPADQPNMHNRQTIAYASVCLTYINYDTGYFKYV